MLKWPRFSSNAMHKQSLLRRNVGHGAVAAGRRVSTGCRVTAAVRHRARAPPPHGRKRLLPKRVDRHARLARVRRGGACGCTSCTRLRRRRRRRRHRRRRRWLLDVDIVRMARPRRQRRQRRRVPTTAVGIATAPPVRTCARTAASPRPPAVAFPVAIDGRTLGFAPLKRAVARPLLAAAARLPAPKVLAPLTTAAAGAAAARRRAPRVGACGCAHRTAATHDDGRRTWARAQARTSLLRHQVAIVGARHATARRIAEGRSGPPAAAAAARPQT